MDSTGDPLCPAATEAYLLYHPLIALICLAGDSNSYPLPIGVSYKNTIAHMILGNPIDNGQFHAVRIFVEGFLWLMVKQKCVIWTSIGGGFKQFWNFHPANLRRTPNWWSWWCNFSQRHFFTHNFHPIKNPGK